MTRSLGAQLTACTSEADLRALLTGLVAQGDRRWKRSMVAYYVIGELHHVLDDYYFGETLRAAANKGSGCDRSTSDSPPATPLERVAPVVDDIIHQFGGTPQPAEENSTKQPGVEYRSEVTRSDDRIGQIMKAISEEIEAQRKVRPVRYRIRSAACTGPSGHRFLYRGVWSRPPDIGIPGDIVIGGKVVTTGRVERQCDGDDTFEVAVESFLGKQIADVQFVADPFFLLREQLRILSAAHDGDPELARRIGTLFLKPDGPVVSQFSPEDAIAACCSSERTYVWGPPGTGKTTTLGALAQRLVQDGRRVLVLSPNNVAVDQAALAIGHHAKSSPARVIRIGRMTREVLEAGIHIEAHLEAGAKASGVLEAARRLYNAARAGAGLSTGSPRTVRACLEGIGQAVIELGHTEDGRQARLGLSALRRAFMAPERALVEGSAVVVTTNALAMIAPVLQLLDFDHVVVDESSIVRTSEAAVTRLAYSGAMSFFGDPRQLPPIVVARSPQVNKWLRPNPFDLAGLDRPVQLPSSCTFLNRQHRMSPPVRALVSSAFYDDALVDGNCPENGLVIVIDTSRTGAQAMRQVLSGGGSRENPIHRVIVSGVLDTLATRAPKANSLIISPFRSQRRAYRSEPRTNRHSQAVFGTIHASQGSEANVVIIDWTIGPGAGRSRFVDDAFNDHLPNLANVAMSRARQILVWVMNRHYLEEEYSGGLLHRLDDQCRANGVVIDAGPDLAVSRPWRAALDRAQLT